MDLLLAHDGRTLNELCEHLEMTRQGVTQHLDLLEVANLVATVRRGREELHFLNPVPLQEIYERWIAKFENRASKCFRIPRNDWRKTMPKSTFVYVTYIRTTPEKLWSALTDDVEFKKQHWFGVHCESQWTAGSSWKMVHPAGHILDAGEIVEAEPRKRLVIRWRHQDKPELKAGSAVLTDPYPVGSTHAGAR